MVRERVKEVVDFATSTSPYKNANQGWLNNDVFLKWGSTSNEETKDGKEFLDIFVFWEPIQKLVLILFLILSIASLLVVSSLSFAKGNFELGLNIPAISFEANNFEEATRIEVNNSDQQEFSNESVLGEAEDLRQDFNDNTEENQITFDEVEVPPKSLEEPMENPLPTKSHKNTGTAGNLF